MSPSTRVFVVAAKRTPFGAFGGALKNFTATQLGAIAARAAIEQLPTDARKNIDNVIFGNVAQTSMCAAYMARHIALSSGLSIETPALTINRLCGSGFEAAILGAQIIRAGDSQLALVGGAECMSMAPFAARTLRWGVRYGSSPVLEDTLATALIDRYPNPPIPMGVTAENLARRYSISRQQCDEYALQSQTRWAAAHKDGRFLAELVEVVALPSKKGAKPKSLQHDEHPRMDASYKDLVALSPVFEPPNGTVTAGNASGISDGGAALVLASEEAVRKYSLTKLAELTQHSCVGVDPAVMGIGPVPAVRALLQKRGIEIKDLDIVEVNEAFAAQYLAVEQELGLLRERTNTNGGAIAIGHPLAASGARILGHLCYELQRTNKRLALGAACIGGGQGIAILLEK